MKRATPLDVDKRAPVPETVRDFICDTFQWVDVVSINVEPLLDYFDQQDRKERTDTWAWQ